MIVEVYTYDADTVQATEIAEALEDAEFHVDMVTVFERSTNRITDTYAQ